MSFAHWRKCDFQIHTPRDPNWTGAAPVGVGEKLPNDTAATAADVDAARDAWADQFVAECHKRGLEAIALTDHHEMVMVPYVQKAIARHKVKNPGDDLWLFPGMELTAHGGVQCLILFDADLSEDWRKQAQGKLGIVYADLEEKAAKGPKVTQLTCNYADIGNELDAIEQLKGRYIVLPNVSQGGNHTVLKDGSHADFKRMPYVGGYLDNGQSIKTLGGKNKTRISGTDKTWSAREIYPLPTSDSRTADFANLGTNSAWIKLAAPTAEALRQAFLGHPSRITIEGPATPALTVLKVSVKSSTVLQDSDISMSPELNCVIGGRGSGKSSFLEYLSFGLGRSCYDVPRDHYSNTERMRELINDTVVSKGGAVQLDIAQDGAVFRVRRAPATSYQPQVTYPNGSTQTITVKELRALFPALVYSQGELAEIGKQAGNKTQLSDLLQFVNPERKRDDDKLNSDIDAAKALVRKAVITLTAFWGEQAGLRKLITSRESLKERAEALEKTLPALSDADKAVVADFDTANEFETKRMQASKHADSIVAELNSMNTELIGEKDLATTQKGVPQALRAAYQSLYKDFATGLAQLQKAVGTKRVELKKSEDEWSADLKKKRAARDAVLEKLGAHKTVTAQIIKLREELTEITNQIADVEVKIKAAGDPSASLATAIKSLRDATERRATETVKWAEEIEGLSSGKIKATIEAAGDAAEIRDALEVVAAKTGSQEAARLKRLGELLEKEAALDILDKLRTDCMSLLYWRLVGSATGDAAPKCEDLFGLLGTSDKLRNTVTELMDTARIEAIAAAVPKPQISLSYHDGTREISFEKASEGQRAAALLFMLLEQPGGPLIVDQPEGDLDNSIITDLTDKLHEAKRRRQIVFASHNANIVVNGSAELVGHLDVKDDGQRQFQCTGAIDAPVVCKVITRTMEGGEKAFRDRQNKYGY